MTWGQGLLVQTGIGSGCCLGRGIGKAAKSSLESSGAAGDFQASSRSPDSAPHAGGRYIEVFREKSVPTAKGPLKNSTKPWQGRTLGENEEEEDLADSGRLFVRNLPYTSTEEDLEKIFSKYGRDAIPQQGAHTESTRRETRPPGSRPSLPPASS